MIIIGNDFIDMSVPENLKTFSRKGIEKFFSEHENIIAKTDVINHNYARLWAMKESIYKCMLKLGYKHAFSPAKIILDVENEIKSWSASTIIDSVKYFALCKMDGNYIECVASNSKKILKDIESFMLKTNISISKQSLLKLNKRYNMKVTEIIKTTLNIPLALSESNFYYEISLSSEESLYLVSIYPTKLNVLECNYLNLKS